MSCPNFPAVCSANNASNEHWIAQQFNYLCTDCYMHSHATLCPSTELCMRKHGPTEVNVIPFAMFYIYPIYLANFAHTFALLSLLVV